MSVPRSLAVALGPPLRAFSGGHGFAAELWGRCSADAAVACWCPAKGSVEVGSCTKTELQS